MLPRCPIALLIVSLPLCATACLAAKEAVAAPSTVKASLQAALCEYQVRCGYIGASEEDACNDAASFGELMLDGRPLWRESGAYSTTEALRAGRLGVDPLRREACFAALADPSCAASEVFACAAVLEPRVPAGGACEADRECVTRICAQAMGDFGPWSGGPGCGGRCVAEADLGEPCGIGKPNCDFTAGYCDSERCTAWKEEGEACTSDLLGGRCAPGLVCSRDGLCAAPAAPVGEGEPCEMTTGLGGLAGLGLFPFNERGGCAPGLFCDVPAGVGTCRAALPDGAACDRPDACRARRPCLGLHVTSYTAEVHATGRCASWADLGEACIPGATITGCPRDMLCDTDAMCVPRDVPTVPFAGTCDPSADAARADQCAEGVCDPASRTCVLRCSPP